MSTAAARKIDLEFFSQGLTRFIYSNEDSPKSSDRRTHCIYHIYIYVRMNSIPLKDSPDINIPRRTHQNQVLSYSEYRGVTDGSIFI
jgi:hypothetical protein